MAVAAVGSVALCATMAFVAALTGYVSSSDLDSAAYKMAASQAEITESLITDSDGVRKVYNVYGQINVYGVTTKSERHKRSYWTRTADGNGIGGRKAPVPYGS